MGDDYVMINRTEGNKWSVRLVSGKNPTNTETYTYYTRKQLDADEIVDKLKKQGWREDQLIVEHDKENKTAMNKLSLKISEELQLKLAKTLYTEDGDGGTAAGGGLASASDLGMLPKVNLGGVGIGFEKRRRNRMRSEEGYTTYNETPHQIADRGIYQRAQGELNSKDSGKYTKADILTIAKYAAKHNKRAARDREASAWEDYEALVISGFLRKAYEWNYLSESDGDDGGDSQDAALNNPTAPPQDGEEGVEEVLHNAAALINSLYGNGIDEAEAAIFMVSWMDPRVVDNDALHKRQRLMGNGLHYVTFSGGGEARDFYGELRAKGINNVKLDALG